MGAAMVAVDDKCYWPAPMGANVEHKGTPSLTQGPVTPTPEPARGSQEYPEPLNSSYGGWYVLRVLFKC